MNRKIRGAAMIEFLTVFGLLSFCAFGVIELTKMVEASKALVNISREAANAAKRNCASAPLAGMAACLNQTADKIVQVADTILQSNEADRPFSRHGFIRIIVWKDPNPGTASTNDAPRNLPASPSNAPGMPVFGTAGGLSFNQASAYQNIEASSDYADFSEIYNGQRSVVVSEVYLDYHPITQFLAGLLGHANGDQHVLYQSVLF